MKFSERYGYVKPSEVIITERITEEIQNAICTCYDILSNNILTYDRHGYSFMEQYLWCHFLNQRKNDFRTYAGNEIVATKFIEDEENPWFKKLDIIEESINYLSQKYNGYPVVQRFVNTLNSEFERLNFGYRIINGEIVPITDEQQIQSIETAMEDSKGNIKMHLNEALKLYAQRPMPDYRNSIKESITAVEALSREITGNKSINFKKMEQAGIKIPNLLREAFEKLYGYSNDSKTGIRHALMDETAEYIPGADEALFMLVSCSTFINYLNGKRI